MGDVFWQGARNKKSDIQDVAFKIIKKILNLNNQFFSMPKNRPNSQMPDPPEVSNKVINVNVLSE